MSFKAYVLNRRRGPNPQGDFVEHARSDHAMPDARSWEELRRYLLACGACPGAVRSAAIIWRGYQASLKRSTAPSAPPGNVVALVQGGAVPERAAVRRAG